MMHACLFMASISSSKQSCTDDKQFKKLINWTLATHIECMRTSILQMCSILSMHILSVFITDLEL